MITQAKGDRTMPGKDDIVMVSAVRTPFSRFDTAMADIPSIDLGVMVMQEVIKRVGIKPEEVDEINYGNPSCGVSGGKYLAHPGQGLLLVADDTTAGHSRHPGGRSRDRHVRGFRKHAPHPPPGPGASEGKQDRSHPPH
jgi:hypothetical protein